MNGVPCNMQAINELAEEYGIAVLEDAAQSFGSKLGAQSCGSFGKFAAFSLHPLKTLNVAGDGGFLTTNSKTLARKVLALRNIGQEEKGIHSLLGFNSRLDNIQAAIANIKLDYFETAINRRSQIAERYLKGLKGTQIELPLQSLSSESEVASNFSNFVIMVTDRDKLREELTLSGIETLVAWDPPIYQSDFVKIKSNSDFPNTERIAKQSLNLPINQYMMDSETDEVILNIKRFLC